MSVRRHLHDAIQESAGIEDADTGRKDLEGAFLMGWTMVAEWMSPEGDRWLARMSGDAAGENPVPTWINTGYLYDALHGDWSEPGGDDE